MYFYCLGIYNNLLRFIQVIYLAAAEAHSEYIYGSHNCYPSTFFPHWRCLALLFFVYCLESYYSQMSVKVASFQGQILAPVQPQFCRISPVLDSNRLVFYCQLHNHSNCSLASTQNEHFTSQRRLQTPISHTLAGWALQCRYPLRITFCAGKNECAGSSRIMMEW